MRAPGPRRRERGTTRTRAAAPPPRSGWRRGGVGPAPRGARRREAQDEERGGGGGVPRRRHVSRVPRADPQRRLVRLSWRGVASHRLRDRERARRVQGEKRAGSLAGSLGAARAGHSAREFRAHPRARRPSFALGPLAVSARARQELPVRQAPERARGSRPRVPRDGVDEDPGDVQGRAPRRVPGGVEFGPERGQRGGEARARDETRRRNAPPRLERRVESGERRGAERGPSDPGDR